MSEAPLDVSVVIPCHTEKRWDELSSAILSAASQVPPPKSVIVSVDGNQALYDRLMNIPAEITVVLNTGQPGASATRNAGAAIAGTPMIAFLDDDATARPGWLANLIEPFAETDVVGTGGFVAPHWIAPEPRWFPEEFAWFVGSSFRGLPTTRSPIRNVWSENMAVRRSAFEEVGGFRADFTKVGNVSRPDDTDLCVRMGKVTPEATWIFVPDAIVDHDVGAERARFSFFLRRCYSEGRGKVELARGNDGRSDLGDEQAYLRKVIPLGIARYFLRGMREREVDDVRRALAMVCGLMAAGCGAAIAIFRGRR